MTALILILAIIVLTTGTAEAARRVRAANIEEARRREDNEYLEACLNRERSHDFPMDFSAKEFEEGFWRGWNR